MGWMTPSPLQTLVDALGDLYAITARRREGSEDRQAVVLLTANAVQPYPWDLALAAIRGWRGIYFPTAEELRRKIEADRDYRVRCAKVRALEDFLHAPERPAGPPPTDEQREELRGFAERLKTTAPAPRPIPTPEPFLADVPPLDRPRAEVAAELAAFGGRMAATGHGGPEYEAAARQRAETETARQRALKAERKAFQ